jgi:hypothetical protein
LSAIRGDATGALANPSMQMCSSPTDSRKALAWKDPASVFARYYTPSGHGAVHGRDIK